MKDERSRGWKCCCERTSHPAWSSPSSRGEHVLSWRRLPVRADGATHRESQVALLRRVAASVEDTLGNRPAWARTVGIREWAIDLYNLLGLDDSQLLRMLEETASDALIAQKHRTEQVEN